MSAESKDRWGIPDTYVFDSQQTRRGYKLNKMCFSLCKAENRAAFVADEEAYLTSFDLTDEEKKAIKDRDWLKAIQLGGNIYFVMKVGAVVKQGLYVVGAQQRGQTFEQFLGTRNVKDAI